MQYILKKAGSDPVVPSLVIRELMQCHLVSNFRINTNISQSLTNVILGTATQPKRQETVHTNGTHSPAYL